MTFFQRIVGRDKRCVLQAAHLAPWQLFHGRDISNFVAPSNGTTLRADLAACMDAGMFWFDCQEADEKIDHVRAILRRGIESRDLASELAPGLVWDETTVLLPAECAPFLALHRQASQEDAHDSDMPPRINNKVRIG
jgi:hypothetical protein